MRPASETAALFWDDVEARSDNGPQLLFARCRIDNRRDLIAELGLAHSVSDEQLLVALYKQYGQQCADKILGDFGFAIHDPARRHVYLARDIMGCQPLYYCRNNSGLFVSDTIEQLVARSEVSDEEDLPFLAASLSYSFVHFERTSFVHIRKVPPGQYAVAGKHNYTQQPYWDPRQIKQRRWPSHEACLEEFRSLLRKAICDRLPGEGHVGVHVSGGLDCSSIALLTEQALADAGKAPPTPYSWYPPPDDNLDAVEREEYERLDAVFSAMDAAPVYTMQTADNVLATLAQDGRVKPICNASYNERMVLEDARQRGVSVIMSGFGGDETASFDGRGLTYELALKGQWVALKPFAAAEGQGWLRYCFNQTMFGVAHRLLPNGMLNRLQYGLTGKGYSKLGIVRRLLWPGPKKGDADTDPELRKVAYETRDYRSASFANAVEPLPPIEPVRYTTSKAARCNLLRWPGLISRLEAWDAQAADYGVKHVYPLLDRRIVEFTLSLPGQVFRDVEWKRLFFRQAMDDVLPAEVCWREVKADPARITPLIESMEQAYVQIAHAIRAGHYQGRDADRLDMNRLANDIEEIGVRDRKRLGRLMQAVEFLGTRPLQSREDQ